MVRYFLQFVLPLILPTVLYFVAVPILQGRARKAGASEEEINPNTPWIRLIIAGVVLMGVGLAVTMLLTPAAPPTAE